MEITVGKKTVETVSSYAETRERLNFVSIVEDDKKGVRFIYFGVVLLHLTCLGVMLFLDEANLLQYVPNVLSSTLDIPLPKKSWIKGVIFKAVFNVKIVWITRRTGNMVVAYPPSSPRARTHRRKKTLFFTRL